MEATLEAPQPITADPQVDFDAAIQLHNQQGAAPKAEVAAPAAKPKAEVKQADKTQAKPAEKATRERTLQPVKTAEEIEQAAAEVPESGKAEEAEPRGMKPEAMTRWKELRAIEDEHKSIKPEYEKLKAKVAELESKPNIPKDMQERYAELEKWHAAKEVEKTPAYLEAVGKPWAQLGVDLAELSEYTKIPEDRIREVMTDRNRLRRNDAIADLFRDGDKPLSDGTLNNAYALGDQMHKIWKEDARLRDEASAALNVLEGQRKHETEKQQQERIAKFEAARSEAYKLIEGSLGLVLKDNPELQDALQNRQPSEEPMEQAMAALSHEVLPDVVKAWNKDRLELFELRKKLAARRGAQPTIEGTPRVSADEAPAPDFDAAISQYNSRTR